MIYWGTDDDGKLTYGPSQASGGNHSSPISLGYSGSTSSQNKTIDVTFKKEFTSVTFGPGTGDVSLSASGLANEA